jgi:hypothetical protein
LNCWERKWKWLQKQLRLFDVGKKLQTFWEDEFSPQSYFNISNFHKFYIKSDWKVRTRKKTRGRKATYRWRGCGEKIFTALKVPKLCLLVLPVKVIWG